MSWNLISICRWTVYLLIFLMLQLKCEEERCYSEFSSETLPTTFASLIMERQNDDKKNEHGHHNSAEVPQNMAVVLYDESVLSPFHRDMRQFEFDGKQIVIKQNWKDLGLAAVVWDAAVVLGEYLVLNRSLVNRKRVIELGAGTGLTGIVAGLLGAEITITDRKIALDHIQENVDANFKNMAPNSMTVQELDWGHDLTLFEGHYDLILGADIIYIEETFPDLLKTLLHLADCETMVLISCKIRYDRDTRFLTLMSKHFSVDKVFYDEARDIHIYAGRKSC